VDVLISATEVRRRWWLAGLLLLAIAVRLATLGAYPLMDNTEARYAELARKMVETGEWLMPQAQYGVPWWSKPPLSIWLTAVSYLVFGVNEFAARLPQLILSLGTMWLTMNFAARNGKRGVALRSAIVLFTSVLFFGAAGAVETDATLVLGTTLSMVGFWNAVNGDGPSSRAWGYVFFVGMAIGLLAKGLVGIVLTLAPCGLWTIWKGSFVDVWRRIPWLSGSALCGVLSVPWFVAAEVHTPGFLNYFIIGEHFKRYTVSGWGGDMFGTAHARPRGTIWPLAIIATLPWCITWVGLRWQMRRRGAAAGEPDRASWRAYLWLWVLASPIFFTFAGNILITYVLPAIPAFALLVGETWEAVGDDGLNGLYTRIAALIVPLGATIAVLFVVPRIAPEHTQKQIVAEYAARRTDEGQRLVYLEEAPQSAQFYARGKVTTAASSAELESIVEQGRRDFLVIKVARLDEMPQLKNKLTLIGRYGKYLFLAIAPAPDGPT
jgi:4-amino-4-deoxy-L-arabinose transferase-like glycosyltransferase